VDARLRAALRDAQPNSESVTAWSATTAHVFSDVKYSNVEFSHGSDH
jgi:hypothetical protein